MTNVFFPRRYVSLLMMFLDKLGVEHQNSYGWFHPVSVCAELLRGREEPPPPIFFIKGVSFRYDDSLKIASITTPPTLLYETFFIPYINGQVTSLCHYVS